jgi:hypothetical protein
MHHLKSYLYNNSDSHIFLVKRFGRGVCVCGGGVLNNETGFFLLLSISSLKKKAINNCHVYSSASALNLMYSGVLGNLLFVIS